MLVKSQQIKDFDPSSVSLNNCSLFLIDRFTCERVTSVALERQTNDSVLVDLHYTFADDASGDYLLFFFSSLLCFFRRVTIIVLN